MSELMRCWLPGLAVALVASGCLFENTSLDAPLPRTCFDANLHCDAERGEICRRADGSGSPVSPGKGQAETFDGICVLAGTQGAGEVYLELQPTDASSPRIQFGPVSLAKGQNQELAVPSPVAVSGLVTYAQGIASTAVGGARVRFRSVPLIPGRSLLFEAQSSLETDALGRYERLLPVGNYLVTVQPPSQDEVRAPLERPFGQQPVEVAAPGRLELTVTHPNALLSVSGQVLVRRHGKDEPAVGLHVWAMQADVEKASARAGTGTTLAQPALTGDQGQFTLWLPGLAVSAEPHRLRLEVGPSADGEPFPSFRIDDEVLEVAAPVRLSRPVLLSRNGDDLARTTVKGRVTGPGGQPVAMARVSLRTDEKMPFAFSTTVVADDEGRYETTVFAGRYLASATAPESEAEMPLGMCSHPGGGFEAEVDDSTAVELSCEERRYLYGQVIDARARPVPDVTVAADRRADERSPDQLHAERITDAEGRFRLALTPGTYDFSFAPPASVAALKTIKRVLVDDRQGDSLLVFALDPPFELFGQLVSDGAGQPLNGALEAWVVDSAGGATLVGRGIAQRDGAYSIVLPAVGQ